MRNNEDLSISWDQPLKTSDMYLEYLEFKNDLRVLNFQQFQHQEKSPRRYPIIPPIGRAPLCQPPCRWADGLLRSPLVFAPFEKG